MKDISLTVGVVAFLLSVGGCYPPSDRCANPVKPESGQVFELPGFGTITTLGSLGGSGRYPAEPVASAYAVNAAGMVVGSAWDRCDRNPRAFLWQDGTIRDLGTLGGSQSSATDINDLGQVVGESTTGKITRIIPVILYVYLQEEHLAFLWENGQITRLVTPPGAIESGATGINANGQIVGYAGFDWSTLETQNGEPTSKRRGRSTSIIGPASRAMLWELVDGAWQVTPLAEVADGQSLAADINARGQIVGWATTLPTYEVHASVWEAGTLTDLGTLGGTWSEAAAINDAGQIVGWASPPEDLDAAVGPYLLPEHAVLWEQLDGAWQIVDLGILDGGRSEAHDINSAGQVVGWFNLDESNARHALLWQDGAMSDLNTLLPADSGWELLEASAINDAGQITATARRTGDDLELAVLIELAP